MTGTVTTLWGGIVCAQFVALAVAVPTIIWPSWWSSWTCTLFYLFGSLSLSPVLLTLSLTITYRHYQLSTQLSTPHNCPYDHDHVPRMRSINLRDASTLKKTIDATLQLLFEDYTDVKVPSSATMSRARRKVDLAMMHFRRHEWQQTTFEPVSIQLGA